MKNPLNLYLLINYSAAVQLSNVENERAFIVSDFFIVWQCMHLYLTLFFFLFYRSVPFGYQLIGFGGVLYFFYKVVRPAFHQQFRTAGLAQVYRELPRGRRAIYTLISCTMSLGVLVLIYAVLLFRQSHSLSY